MAVYVDSMKARFGKMLMSHMMADSVEELHEMADKIGLKRCWFQNKKNKVPHYDVSQSKRDLAVKFGAREIGIREVMELIKKHRKGK